MENGKNYYKKEKGVIQILTAAFTYSTIFFVIGLAYDIILYIWGGEWTMSAVNGATTVAMLGVYTCFRKEKCTADTGLTLTMFAISANIAITILYEAWVEQPDSSFKVLLGMCICTMPIILVSLTSMKSAPVIITMMALGAYVASALLLDDNKLISCMPTLMLLYIGAPIALRSIIIISRRLERQSAEVTEEKEEFLRLMHIGNEHLSFLGAPDRKEAAKLIDKLDVKVRDTLVLRAREVIVSEENIKEALILTYPTLTDAELETAVLVVNNKTVSEICAIRHVSPSTVTSIRSRLRKKLELMPGESLKGCLTTVANNYVVNLRL